MVKKNSIGNNSIEETLNKMLEEIKPKHRTDLKINHLYLYKYLFKYYPEKLPKLNSKNKLRAKAIKRKRVTDLKTCWKEVNQHTNLRDFSDYSSSAYNFAKNKYPDEFKKIKVYYADKQIQRNGYQTLFKKEEYERLKRLNSSTPETC